MVGNITKEGTDYRKDLLKKVENDTSHPINNGVHMQAHHLISEEGLKMSGMGALLKQKGYNINEIKNMAFIPSTLPGACHLGVQPHRGNHTYTDDEHPNSYHISVKIKVEKLRAKIKQCETVNSAKETQRLLDGASRKLLKKINDFRIPLTPLMSKFKIDEPVGCGNCINIKEHEDNSEPCRSDRNHHQEKHAMYKNGKDLKKITIPKIQYVLKVGK